MDPSEITLECSDDCTCYFNEDQATGLEKWSFILPRSAKIELNCSQLKMSFVFILNHSKTSINHDHNRRSALQTKCAKTARGGKTPFIFSLNNGGNFFTSVKGYITRNHLPEECEKAIKKFLLSAVMGYAIDVQSWNADNDPLLWFEIANRIYLATHLFRRYALMLTAESSKIPI